MVKLCKDCRHYKHAPEKADAYLEYECHGQVDLVTGEPRKNYCGSMRGEQRPMSFTYCGPDGLLWEPKAGEGEPQYKVTVVYDNEVREDGEVVERSWSWSDLQPWARPRVGK